MCGIQETSRRWPIVPGLNKWLWILEDGRLVEEVEKGHVQVVEWMTRCFVELPVFAAAMVRTEEG